jgi:transposase
MEKMQAEIEELKAQLKQNSQNSNRPPPSDGVKRPQPAFSYPKGKRGGQPGHQGQTLQRVATLDVVIDCEPVACVCGQPEWRAEGEIVETRQVFEVPEPRGRRAHTEK